MILWGIKGTFDCNKGDIYIKLILMADKTTPPAPIAHVPSEIQVVVTYLGLYRGLYNTPDLTDAGLCRMLMGFRNYLDTLPSSSLTFSGSLATLISKGFV